MVRRYADSTAVQNINNLKQGMGWGGAVELFRFADFIGSDILKHDFVMLLILPMLGGSTFDIPLLRYKLSFSGNESYLQANDEGNWDTDPMEFFDHGDFLLDHVQRYSSDIQSLLGSLSSNRKRSLYCLFPNGHRYRNEILAQIVAL